MNFSEVLNAQQGFFSSGATQSYSFRKEQLKKLKAAVKENEAALFDALQKDLRKNKEEAWITEIGMVLTEIRYAMNNLYSWMQPASVTTNLINLPSSSKIYREPWGRVLIIAPWNYPLQLTLVPLIGAIAGGNCSVIKPSEFAPATAAILSKIIEEIFPPEYVYCVNGEGHVVIPQLMEAARFDLVFYTGSTAVGKMIYQQAAKELTPVVLELGGKSPTIVEADAPIKIAAKRIAVAKFTNAGQTCIAPDYVLVHASQKEALIAAMKETLEKFYGTNPTANPNYGKIINRRQWERLNQYLQEGKIAYGGKVNEAENAIGPTLLTDVTINDKVMQDEIFGPVLPIIAFNNSEEAMQLIRQHPNPLSFYVYTKSKAKEQEWLQNVPAGAVGINGSSMHALNHHLPFGGRGASGIGNYHGKYSFDTFTHRKAVLKTPTWLDPSMKYPPFSGKLGLFKKIIK